MKTEYNSSAAHYLVGLTAACVIALAGCSSDDDDAPAVPAEVSLSGIVTGSDLVTDIDGPLPDVNIEGVYTNPGDADNVTTVTDATGAFLLTVKTSTLVYAHGTLAGYATINTEKVALTSSESDLDIDMPTATEAQEIIDLAFPTTLPQLGNHAWLAVDVEDVNGNEVPGKTISSSVAPTASAYIECDGSASLTAATVACTDRDGAMYLAYFDSATESTVTVDAESKLAPLNLGEVTVIEFDEVAAPVPDDTVPTDPTAFELGQAYYDTNCASCHSAGAYDPDGFAGNLVGVPIPLDLSNIQGMSSVADITVEIQTNLETFLNDPSIQ